MHVKVCCNTCVQRCLALTRSGAAVSNPREADVRQPLFHLSCGKISHNQTSCVAQDLVSVPASQAQKPPRGLAASDATALSPGTNAAGVPGGAQLCYAHLLTSWHNCKLGMHSIKTLMSCK